MKKKNVQNLIIDKQGLHCVAIADHELFYMNWSDQRVQRMSAIPPLDGKKKHKYLMEDQPCNITAVDLALEPGEDSVFDIVFATQDGRIFHAEICYEDGKLEFFEEFECFVDNLADSRPIIDIKVAAFRETQKQTMILVATQINVYQFVGNGSVRAVLEEARKEP